MIVIDSLFFSDIRKLKAVLAAPLDFGDGENDVDGDTASEVSAQPTAKKVLFGVFILTMTLK